MKERPILFSGPMVRAILEGRKTQTRRPVKPQPPAYIDELYGGELRQQAPYQLECHESGCVLGYGFEDDNGLLYRCPFGVPGDRLWVRETFATINRLAGCELYRQGKDDGVRYRATWAKSHSWGWRPSIHMPRWASRITLEVVIVRVERVLDITESDAEAEGFEATFDRDGSAYGALLITARERFLTAWRDIYGQESLDANQWVWVVEFKRLEQESARAH